MSLLRAPRIELRWPASALGASFGGYFVYRRASRAQALPVELIAFCSVPAGYTAATVEAQHNRFDDYEAGWAIAGGQWSDGFDYFVTSLNAATGMQSPQAGASAIMVKQTADTNPWVVSNAAPWLNFPIGIADTVRGTGRSVMDKFDAAGRDLALTRTSFELPERTFTLGARYFDRVGEDVLRSWRAAAASGRAMALHTPRGDRAIGGLDDPGDVPHEATGALSVTGTLTETAGRGGVPPIAGDCNVPAGVVLNGTTQVVTIPNAATLNPGGAFTLVTVGAFANAGASRYAVSKGSIAAAANGYALRTNGVASQLELFVRGAGGNGAVTATSAAMFDGNVHSAIATSSGVAQALYLDDSSIPAATGAIAHGAITNAIAMAIGGDNGGASSFMALAPFVLVAFYNRQLTPTEAVNTARAALGYPGYRLAAGAALLVDLRDARTWPGYGTVVQDLSTIPPQLPGTLVAAPATRGIPQAFATLERF